MALAGHLLRLRHRVFHIEEIEQASQGRDRLEQEKVKGSYNR